MPLSQDEYYLLPSVIKLLSPAQKSIRLRLLVVVASASKDPVHWSQVLLHRQWHAIMYEPSFYVFKIFPYQLSPKAPMKKVILGRDCACQHKGALQN